MQALDKKTCEEVITAIRMRMNYIETGDVLLSAVDVERQKAATRGSLLSNVPKNTAKVKALTREQRDVLNALEDAIKKLEDK